MSEVQYGPSDMGTPRLKRHYRRWQRKAWRWAAKASKAQSYGTRMAGPAGGYVTVREHVNKCESEVKWAAANLKQRGWFIA
jgi:hypothetical protein